MVLFIGMSRERLGLVLQFGKAGKNLSTRLSCRMENVVDELRRCCVIGDPIHFHRQRTPANRDQIETTRTRRFFNNLPAPVLHNPPNQISTAFTTI